MRKQPQVAKIASSAPQSSSTSAIGHPEVSSLLRSFHHFRRLPEPLPTLLKFFLFICSPNFAFNDAIYVSIGAKPLFLGSHLACLLWFAFLTVLYFCCVLYIHKRKLNVSLKSTQTLQDSDFGYEGGVDISEMTTEVNRLEAAQTQDPLKVLHLSKTYPNGFRAVKDISFGVQKGEIFGLLGPNGAGKSTTFHVSTAMIPRSGGEVRLKGHSIDGNLDDVFQDVGVCPQFDAIWEDLKVNEHFYIYALVKGIPLYDLKDVATYLLDAVKLKEHAKKQAKKLSGGSKRKLNTAIALIGTPTLKFFDEPSTGIDPMSKRFLWNCLQKYVTMRNGSILLTTHSMEEAEALCQRIGIIVNGKFVCLGPLQFLKDKYGAGYKITIVKTGERENVDDEIYGIFPNAKKIEEKRESQETYQVMSQSFKFSVALRALGELKRGGIIQDFSIYNTTLEQLFIDFSKNQTEPTLPDQLDSQME